MHISACYAVRVIDADVVSSCSYLVYVFKHVDQTLPCQKDRAQDLTDPAYMSLAAPEGAEVARAGDTSHGATAPRGSAPTAGRGKAEGHPAAKTRSRCRERPAIDLDASIQAAQQAAKDAAKALTKARAEARTERKRRARLIRKAGQLSPADLERIAVLKRTGWWDPSTGTPDASAKAGEGPQPAATEVATNPTRRAASSSDPDGSANSGGAAASVGKADEQAPTVPAAVEDVQATQCAQPSERDNEDGEDEDEQEDDDASAAKDTEEEM